MVVPEEVGYGVAWRDNGVDCLLEEEGVRKGRKGKGRRQEEDVRYTQMVMSQAVHAVALNAVKMLDTITDAMAIVYITWGINQSVRETSGRPTVDHSYK